MTEPDTEDMWKFYGHMDRRWDADPCAPVDYYDPDASLTFPEALRLCCYAADYEGGGRAVPEDARRHFRDRLEAGRRGPIAYFMEWTLRRVPAGRV